MLLPLCQHSLIEAEHIHSNGGLLPPRELRPRYNAIPPHGDRFRIGRGFGLVPEVSGHLTTPRFPGLLLFPASRMPCSPRAHIGGGLNC